MSDPQPPDPQPPETQSAQTQPAEPQPAEPQPAEAQPLPLTAPVWIGLGLVALLAVSRLFSPGGLLSPEPRERRISLQVERHRGGRWQFEELGFQIDLPAGWSYLQLAGAPPTIVTFAHPRSNSIVRLIPNVFDSWPPEDLRTTAESYGGVEIEWIELATTRQISIASQGEPPTMISWQFVDPRRIGRINVPQTDLVIVAITHRRNNELSEAVREFCRSIEMI